MSFKYRRCLGTGILVLSIVFNGCSFGIENNPAKEKDPQVSILDRTKMSELDNETNREIIEDDKFRQEKQCDSLRTELSGNRDIESSVSDVLNNQLIRLSIPQRVQENGYYCGPASLQMVLAYHDIYVTQDQLAVDLNTSPITGTEYEDLARAASSYIFGNIPRTNSDPGYRAVILAPWISEPMEKLRFEERAVQDLINGDPVFVSINNETAYGPGYGTVHQVVLYGVDLDRSGKPINFYYLDPS